MKIYWSDREGNSPPSDAQFTLLPFFSQTSLDLKATLCSLPTPTSAKIVKRTFFPEKKEWIEKVETALALIQKNKLQKIVLARSCTLLLDQAPDPFALTAALQKKAEGAFVFCLETEAGFFLGATPERLFRKERGEIVAEALAGTRHRSLSSAQELLQSPKDLHEFLYVQAYLENTLSPLCLSPVISTPMKIHQTSHLHHLYSQTKGLLKPEVTDFQLLNSLHPTPALCGLPKKTAFSLIRSLEPFDRGFYGGILGWSTRDTSEWIVGIRSCFLQGNQATLFSGAGIVAGSDPEKEWEELNQKIKLYDGILDS